VEDRDGGGASFNVYLPFGTPDELDREGSGSLVAQASDSSRSA
jgi:hypothetical protein